jgi:lipid-binding SYLF domain-containing protein
MEGSMLDDVIHAGATATLTWLTTKDPGLKEALDKAYGYAVFPAMGRASAVLGAARGYGEVFERGKPIGFATLTQMTVGVQVGGQTFSELMLFNSKDALDAYRKGKLSFTANASAVLVKGATGTSDPGSVVAKAYSRGGMLLELSLGGQKFNFSKHAGEGKKKDADGSAEAAPERAAGAGSAEGAERADVAAPEGAEGPDGAAEGAEGDGIEEGAEAADPVQAAATASNETKATTEPATREGHETSVEEDDPPAPPVAVAMAPIGAPGRLVRAGRKLATKASLKAAHFLASHGGKRGRLNRLASALTPERHRTLREKIASAAAGLEKEAKLAPVLGDEVNAALKRMKEHDPSLAEKLAKAYAYAVFPLVGKATAALGVGFGRGEVFERGKLIGYAGIVQLTIGVQVGGQTYDELIVFENEGALKRFKSGKLAFAANASAVIIKAGAAATTNYSRGTAVFVHPEGGLMLELGLGGQKFIFRRKVLGDRGAGVARGLRRIRELTH